MDIADVGEGSGVVLTIPSGWDSDVGPECSRSL